MNVTDLIPIINNVVYMRRWRDTTIHNPPVFYLIFFKPRFFIAVESRFTHYAGKLGLLSLKTLGSWNPLALESLAPARYIAIVLSPLNNLHFHLFIFKTLSFAFFLKYWNLLVTNREVNWHLYTCRTITKQGWFNIKTCQTGKEKRHYDTWIYSATLDSSCIPFSSSHAI